MTETLKFADRNPQGFAIRSAIEPFKFPGGETHLKVPENYSDTPYYARVNGANMDDYMALGLWSDFHTRRDHMDQLNALIPYLPAARSDRGKPVGAMVYADVINSFELNQVIVFDPHSEVMPNLVNNVTVVHAARTAKNATIGYHDNTPHDYVGVIAPDKGAHERAKRTAEVMHLPLFQAEKHRDFETGKLTGFECEPLPETGRLLVVDDICDGGGTFMGLAEATGVERERLTLFVSHGIFSGNASKLWDYYGDIITTDSHPGHNNIGATVVPIAPVLIHTSQRTDMLEHNKGYAENLADIQARKPIFKYSEFYTSYEEGWNDAVRKPISDFEMEAAREALHTFGLSLSDDEMFDVMNASRDARVKHYERDTMIPGSAEDLIDDVMEEVRYYAHDYNTFHPATSFRDVENSLEKALAKVWQDAYDLGVHDQITSESTDYSPSRPNPYKKVENND